MGHTMKNSKSSGRSPLCIRSLRALLLAAAAIPNAVYAEPVVVHSATIGPNDTTIQGVALDYADVVVAGVLTISGTHTFHSLTVQGWCEVGGGCYPGIVRHAPNDPNGLDLTVLTDVWLKAAVPGGLPEGRIDVTGMGYPADQGPGAGQMSNSKDGTGGGHAGWGGTAQHGGVGGSPYQLTGDVLNPTEFGSGGGSSLTNDNIPRVGGAGGGFAKITVLGQLRVDGALAADGAPGESDPCFIYACGNSSGAGAGGSLQIDAHEIVGTGRISAKGGDAGHYLACGGVDCQEWWSGGGGGGRVKVVCDSWQFAGEFSAAGGSGFQYGGAGTVALQTPQTARPMITASNKNAPATAAGTAWFGGTTFDANLTVSGNARLVAAAIGILDLSILGNCTVDAGSAVSVTGQGYPSGQGPGAGTTGGGEGGGGAHAGVGGNTYQNGALGSTMTYGSVTNPSTPGSGGGSNTSQGLPGGAGGGVAYLTIGGTLHVEGKVSADGAAGTSTGYYNGFTCSGGGAGGSLVIDAGRIEGTGVITANGGAGGSSGACGGLGCAYTFSGDGGGGRIAISVPEVFDFLIAADHVQAWGGATSPYPGEAGTVVFSSARPLWYRQPTDGYGCGLGAEPGNAVTRAILQPGVPVTLQWTHDGATLTDSEKYSGTSTATLTVVTSESETGTFALRAQRSPAQADSNSVRIKNWDLAWSLRNSVDASSSSCPRSESPLVFDFSLATVSHFGGQTVGGVWRSSLSWNGSSWQSSFPSPNPYFRTRHTFSFDTARNRAVLFGGYATTGSPAPYAYMGDTWERQGGTWTQLTPESSPLPRQLSAAVFDSTRSRTILFGGRDGTTRFGDTWAWDGANWTQASSGGPSGRTSPAMAYDAVRDRVVLFGGFTTVSGSSGETWEFDGLAWTLVATTGPSPRAGASLVFDPDRHLCVLFGGTESAAATLYNDMWTWNGSIWRLESVAGGPSPRFRHGAVFDPVRHVTVYAGGFLDNNFTTYSGETWEFAETSPGFLITQQPSTPPPLVPGQRLKLVTKASGTPAAILWTRNGVPIIDGSGGSSPAGGFVRGAYSTTLIIDDTSETDSGYYQCSLLGCCGSPATQLVRVTVGTPCPGDLNGDNQVDDADFVIFASAYNILVCDDPAMPPGCPADLNTDTYVDDADFVLFAAAYDALLCP